MPTEREAIRAIRAMLRDNPATAEKIRKLALLGELRGLEFCASSPEEVIVIASTDHCGIAGCKQAFCKCGKPVWLAPSTQEMLAERGANPTRIMCVLCLWQLILKTGEIG